MKNFKNNLAVIGPKSLLKAFAEELDKLEHVRDKGDFGNFDRKDVKSILIYNEKYDYIHNFTYGLYSHHDVDYQKLYLPQDWDLALKLASEVEEEIPEYVEILINKGIFKKGEILKTEKYYEGNWRFVWPDGSGQVYDDYYKVYYKQSTKEAYEAQFKSKPGKWYFNGNGKTLFLENTKRDQRIGFNADGVWSKGIGKGGDNSLRLATDEEVKTALVNEAQKRYSVGVMVDQTTAYGGKGSKLSIKDGSFTFTIPYFPNGYYNLSVGGVGVFNTEEGKWAEVVVEDFKINGYTVIKVDNTRVKVGCKMFYINQLKSILNFLKEHGGFYLYDDICWNDIDIEKLIDKFEKM